MIPRVPFAIRFIVALPVLAIGAITITVAEWCCPEMFGHPSRDQKEPRT